MSELFDPGLQPERTLLAWRRTLLSIAVAGLVGLRLLPSSLGAWSLPIPLGVIAVALALHTISERRFRRGYAALTSANTLPAAGRITLALALLMSASAVASIIFVLSVAENA